MKSGTRSARRFGIGIAPAVTVICGIVCVGSTALLFDQAALRPVCEGRSAEPNYELFELVHLNDPDGIRRAIAAGADIEHVNRAQTTPLILAARGENFEAACTLIDLGADVNHITEASSPLTAAARNDDARLVRVLLDAGADPTRATALGTTPFWAALESGGVSLEIVPMLFDAGADIDQPAPDGQTPIEFAIAEGDRVLIRTLLDLGADTAHLDADVRAFIEDDAAVFAAVEIETSRR